MQIDPIRKPAHAQDLILRQRVRGYRTGDIARRYAELDIDEDVLYAYGYTARRLRPLLHPRHHPQTPDGRFPLDGLHASVLAFVRDNEVTHPRDVQQHFGHRKATNAWGGTSSATTLVLEQLHRYGQLRVTDRLAGIRRYEVAPPMDDRRDPVDRARELVVRIAHSLAPVIDATLARTVNWVVRSVHGPQHRGGSRPIIEELAASGALEGTTCEGLRYLWPSHLTPTEAEPPRRVRILAPFDPLVWDRQRFGHFWGWDYRFEAYTPASKRVLGYYAMPMLWRDSMIGWATCDDRASGVQVGFVDGAPRGASFASAFDAEISRFMAFLAGPAVARSAG